MVFTRNQKRKFEETPDVLLIDEENFSNISFTKKNKEKDTKINKEMTNVSVEEMTNVSEEEMTNVSEEEIEEMSENDTEYVEENLGSILKRSIVNLVKSYRPNKKQKKMDSYDKFLSYTNSIYEGNFFEIESEEDKKKKLEKGYTLKEIDEMNNQLNTIQNKYKNNCPSVIDILKMEIPISEKQKLLEKFYHLVNSDILSQEYNSNLKYINSNINTDPTLLELEESIKKKALEDLSYKHKILKSKMTFENKVVAYQKLEIMETYEQSASDEYIKYKNWLDTLLSIPFGEYNNIPVSIKSDKLELQSFIKNVRNTLDKNLSFLEKPKDQVINIVSQMVRNQDCNINAIGLYGTRGLGKTELCKSIAEALDRPFRTITLGGQSDSSVLNGHGFTYIGSQPGRIIDILKECKSMNPVILFDELDKVSETQHGKEIIGTLIHLTDSSINNKYNGDKYYSGIEFDLSKVLFIFTYNDPTKVDKILADRLYKIKVDNYKLNEKLEITKKHLISTIMEKLHLDNEKIKFSDDAIEYLVQASKEDDGMRNIKTKIKIILSRINILLLTDSNDNIINLKYKKLYSFYNKSDNQNLDTIIIPKDHIDILLDESISTDNDDKFLKPPEGMYI